MFPTTPLQKGATGDSVKKLQDYLKSQGLMTQDEINTGYGTYGDKTQAAVTALQTKLGVDNTSGAGFFGPRTIAAIQGTSIPNAGATTIPQISGTVNSGNISPTSPINYETPKPTMNYPVGSLDTTIPTPAAVATPAEAKANTLTDQLRALNDSLVGKSTYQTQQETEAGVATLNATITDLSSQLVGLQNEAKAIPVQLQNDVTGRGVTTGGISPIQTEQLRNNAIKALTVSTLLDAAKGNLSTAQAKADAAVEAKYGPVQEKITAATANLNLILSSPEYTLEEKNRAQQQLDIQNARQEILNTAKTDAKSISNMAIASTSNASSFKAATVDGVSYPTLATALNGIANAKTPMDAAKIQAATGLNMSASDKLDLTYKQSQIDKLNSDANASIEAGNAVDPNTLQGMINVYQQTGVMPSFGMGKTPLRAQFYAALGGADGSNIVNDAATAKNIRAGINSSLSTQQKQYDANRTAIGTLDKQLELAKQYSDKVSRSNSPLVNKYIVATQTGIFGDPETTALNNIVTTASYELAKILSGSAASIAGATVTSSEDAKKLLNSAMSRGQFNEVLGLMQKEAQFRLNSQKETIASLRNDLTIVPQLIEDAKVTQHNVPSAPAGMVNIRKPDGTTGVIPKENLQKAIQLGATQI